MCVDLSYLASSNRYLLRHRSQYFVDILLVLSPRITHSSLNLIDFTLPVRSALALHVLHRKEVIQPHLPIRLPCYDFTPIIGPTLDGWLLTVTPPASGVTNFRGVTGGVYKARKRIHRSMLTCDY